MKHIITALALVASTTASAQFIDGNALYKRMTDESPTNQIMALGYIAGVSDLGHGEYHCTPASVTLKQTNDVVLKYLLEEPSNRHKDASVLVTVALIKSWPCAKKGSDL
jgi:hypothetical protein